MSNVRIFVSHSSADKAVVKAIMDRLGGPASPIDIWYDEKSLTTTAIPIERRLRQAILEDCDFTIAFFSAAALRSRWFQVELKAALDRERNEQRTVVLPVLLDPDLQIQDLGEPWSDRFMAECRTQSEPALDQVAKQIEKYLFAMAMEWAHSLRKPAGADRMPMLFRKRMDLSGADWIDIFSQARRRIWLIGHSMARVVDLHYSGEVIARRLSAGVDVRLVVLDPFHPGSHLLEVSRQLNEVDLEGKILTTLSNARTVEDVAFQKWNANSAQETRHDLLAPRLRLGLTQSTIHSSIVIVDDRFLVTPYSHIDEMGDQGLLLDLSASDPQHMALCSSFERDFRWHWERSRPYIALVRPVPTQPAPKVEFRIFNHSKAADQSVSWFRRAQARPPLPHLAVVFPTYRCLHGSRIKLSALGEEPPQGEFTHLLCPNCIYGPKLNPKNRQEMPVEEFKSLLDELVNLSIPIVEISGGGEPLHHPKAAELVDVVHTLARRSKTTQFGLMSNIHSLGAFKFADAIIRAFQYTRWSWPEDAETQPSLRDRYMESIREFDSRRKALVEQESISSPRLGIKVLATRRNVVPGTNGEPPIVELVKDLFEAGVDHVRVRTLRSMRNSPVRESLRMAEDDLCREQLNLQRKGLLDRGRTLEIDLKDRTVARNYKCKLSTLICVIDPSGNMRMCWNDMDDAERAIGNVFTDGFRNAWESSRHIKVCKEMDPVSVCNSVHGCHCRLIGYQELVEPASEAMREDPGTRFRDNFL